MIPAPAPGRNAPCPCGSGKRFKQCCGAIEASQAPARAAGGAESPDSLLKDAASRHQAGLLDQADHLYREAIRIDPENAIALHYLGVLAMQRGDALRGAELMKRALALRPDIPDFHTNLGLCHKRLGQVREAIERLRQAVALDPNSALAHNNLAVALHEDCRLVEAIEEFGRALQLDPDYAEAHYNRGLAYLSLGDYTKGWEGYEWRSRCRQFAGREFELPDLTPWRGESLMGKKILVRREQGIGDTIQFLRFLPQLADRGAHVLLEVANEVAQLARSIDPRISVIGYGAPRPQVDFYVNLLGIPRWLGTTIETLPNVTPYLKPDPGRIEKWRTRLEEYPGRKIGLVWSGNPEQSNNHNRSCPLVSLAPLLDIDGCSWFGLQKGPPADQLSMIGQRGIVDLRDELHSFSDTAAVLSVLDLLISVDTSVAHLAGALARPAWVLVCRAPDWRWFGPRPNSPWYPGLRLFRQTTAGDWSTVVEALRVALRARTSA